MRSGARRGILILIWRYDFRLFFGSRRHAKTMRLFGQFGNQTANSSSKAALSTVTGACAANPASRMVSAIGGARQ